MHSASTQHALHIVQNAVATQCEQRPPSLWGPPSDVTRLRRRAVSGT
jgi:hypothetical protein